MTERDYQRLLDTVQDAIDSEAAHLTAWKPADVPSADNDNGAEWALLPFPKGWHASP